MTQPDFILQFLRSPTWRGHTIRTAEEAYIDLLACPADERPTTVIALAERWHLSRPTASKLITEMLKKNFIDAQNHLITDVKTFDNDVKTFDNDVKTFDNDVKTFDTPPLRAGQDNNISNILPPPTDADAGVREEDIPRADDVQAYINQIGGALFSGQAFVDYHTAKCLWNIHNIRPRVWQAIVRTWRERDKQRIQTPQSPHVKNTTPHYHPSSREAERQQRAQALAQHISRLMADPNGELNPDLDF